MDSRLALSVQSTDGTTKRWGPDEGSGDIPTGVSFGTSIPGGFKDLSCSLLREIDSDYPDLGILKDVRAYGAGNETAWEGRHQRFPRQHGDGFGVQPQAVGYAARLRDDPSFRQIYVDRDLARWRATDSDRRLDVMAAGYSPLDATTRVYQGGATLSLVATGPWATASRPYVEAMYGEGLLPIRRIYAAWRRGQNLPGPDPNWSWGIGIATDSQAVGEVGSGNLQAAGPSSANVDTSDPAYRVGFLRLLCAVAGGTSNMQYELLWTCVAVYGQHALTLRGSDTATSARGVFASDVIADIVSRLAPDLARDITATSFVIPQLAFFDPTYGDDAIGSANVYHLHKWGVYDPRTFFYKPWDLNADTVWEARLSSGAKVDLEGDDADNVFNGVIVTFTDPAGARRIVGPPGTIGADQVSTSLTDSDPLNPANVAGIRRWGKLELSFVTTLAAAVQIGAAWIGEKAIASRRGSITLTDTARHPVQGDRPVWAVRAGDWVRVSDHPADVPRKINETRYTHDQRQIVLSTDNTPTLLDSALEQAGVVLSGIA